MIDNLNIQNNKPKLPCKGNINIVEHFVATINIPEHDNDKLFLISLWILNESLKGQ